jgi:hypothetical protein
MNKPIDTNEMRRKVGPSDYDGNDVFALCDEIDRMRGKKQTPPQGKAFVVALQLLEDTAKGEKSSIVLGVHNTNTVEEAIGAALLRHVGEMNSLGAYRAASLSSLIADLPATEEVEVVVEVEDATR